MPDARRTTGVRVRYRDPHASRPPAWPAPECRARARHGGSVACAARCRPQAPFDGCCASDERGLTASPLRSGSTVHVGATDGLPMLVDATSDGAILLRPAAVYPAELYTDRRVAELERENTVPDAVLAKVGAIGSACPVSHLRIAARSFTNSPPLDRMPDPGPGGARSPSCRGRRSAAHRGSLGRCTCAQGCASPACAPFNGRVR